MGMLTGRPIISASKLLVCLMGVCLCAQLQADRAVTARLDLPVVKVTPLLPLYADFCRREPEECVQNGPAVISLTPAVKTLLHQINASVNAEVSFTLDTEQYSREDYWALPGLGKGDCEDIALEKRRRLAKQGLPRAALRVAIVFHKRYLCPHALLTVESDKGTYVLDSFSEAVRIWNQVPYNFASREKVGLQWEHFDQRGWTYEPEQSLHNFGSGGVESQSREIRCRTESIEAATFRNKATVQFCSLPQLSGN